MNELDSASDHMPAAAGKKVSVVIPVYHSENYIERCLTSVFEQTEQSVQIVIVDDASPDSSMKKVSRLLDQSPPSMTVTLCKHEINRGVSAARNTGIESAAGEYLFFLDSDDWLTTDCLEILLNAAEEHGTEVCSGEFKYIYNSEESSSNSRDGYKLHCYSGDDVLKMFSRRNLNSIIACNKLILRTFLTTNRLLFVDKLLHEDNLWSFSWAMRAKTWVHVAATTYYYRKDNSSSITSTEEIADRTVWYFRVLKLMKEDVDRMGGQASEKFHLMAWNLFTFTKVILWHIEASSGNRRRELYAEFCRHNVFHRGNAYHRHMNARYRFLSLGWCLPYPICRIFSPYYLVKFKP